MFLLRFFVSLVFSLYLCDAFGNAFEREKRRITGSEKANR